MNEAKQELTQRITVLLNQAWREEQQIVGLRGYADEREKARADLLSLAAQFQSILDGVGGDKVEVKTRPIDPEWAVARIHTELTPSSSTSTTPITVNLTGSLDDQQTRRIANRI